MSGLAMVAGCPRMNLAAFSLLLTRAGLSISSAETTVPTAVGATSSLEASDLAGSAAEAEIAVAITMMTAKNNKNIFLILTLLGYLGSASEFAGAALRLVQLT
jgi:hypothetical protein